MSTRKIKAASAALLGVIVLAGCSASTTPTAMHEVTGQQTIAAPSPGPASAEMSTAPVVEAQPGAVVVTHAATGVTTTVVPAVTQPQPVVIGPAAPSPTTTTSSPVAAPVSSPEPSQTSAPVPTPAQTQEPEPTPTSSPTPTPTVAQPVTWRTDFDFMITITVVTDGTKDRYTRSGYEDTCYVTNNWGSFTGHVVGATWSKVDSAGAWLAGGAPTLTWSKNRIMASVVAAPPIGTRLDTYAWVWGRATCEFTR